MEAPVSREIDDLEATVNTPWPKRTPKGPRGMANARRRQARSLETRARQLFQSKGREPSLPKFKCLEE
jgi:hypothetical protein